jgi:hypothetical protein
VAAVDVDGDGKGRGRGRRRPGGGPAVTIVRIAGNSAATPLGSFFAFDPAIAGGVNVAGFQMPRGVWEYPSEAPPRMSGGGEAAARTRSAAGPGEPGRQFLSAALLHSAIT